MMSPICDDHDRTEAALVSPSGTAGVALIQVRGRKAWSHVQAHVVDSRGRPLAAPGPQHPRLVWWRDRDEAIDEALLTVSPSSPGGAPVVTICTHGGVRIVERVLEGLSRSGVSILNAPTARWTWSPRGPLDIDLMDALPRCLTQRATAWLVEQHCILPDVVRSCCDALARNDTQSVMIELQGLVLTAGAARILLQGAAVAIIGPPNAGKSTLANQLFERPWSLESHEPGTTRDWVSQQTAIDGVPIEVLDTAGLRETADDLERLAIAHNDRVLQAADVRMLVLDITMPDEPQEAFWERWTTQHPPELILLNKVDLLQPTTTPGIQRSWTARLRRNHPACKMLEISAQSGRGLESLRRHIIGHLLPNGTAPQPAVWSDRQVAHIEDALMCLPEAPERARSILQRGFLASES